MIRYWVWAIIIAITCADVWAQTSSYPKPPVLAPSNPKPAPAADASPKPPVKNSEAAPESTKDLTPITAANLNSMEMLDEKVKLGIGDRISFRVIEDRDEAVPRYIMDSGEVDFPYVGRVKVAGKTCKEVAVALKRLLEVDYYYQATVIVGLDAVQGQVFGRMRVWVVGQVRSVGAQDLLPNERTTVSQVILRAGGFTDFANSRRVKLVRRGSAGGDPTKKLTDADLQKNSIEVDVKAVFQGESAQDPAVGAEDLIIVPERLIKF